MWIKDELMAPRNKCATTDLWHDRRVRASLRTLNDATTKATLSPQYAFYDNQLVLAKLALCIVQRQPVPVGERSTSALAKMQMLRLWCVGSWGASVKIVP
jgi:hypothetical protein